MKRGTGFWLLTGLVVVAAAACTQPRRPGDEQILEATSDAERDALRERREELELEFDAVLQRQQEEIKRLERENKDLRKRLGL